MPMYYFDERDGVEVVLDEEGVDLSSMDDVQNQSAYALADILGYQLRAANGNALARHLVIEVRDSDGPVLHTTFSFEIKRSQ